MMTPLSPLRQPAGPRARLRICRRPRAAPMMASCFLERRRAEALTFDDGRIKTASYDASEGFGLRAVQGEVTGYAHSSDVSEPALRRAVDTARLAVGAGGGTLADAPGAHQPASLHRCRPDRGRVLSRQARDPARDRRLRARSRSARGAGDRLDRRLVPGGGDPAPRRPGGGRYPPDDRLNVSIIVEQDGRREQGSAGGGGRVGLDGLLMRPPTGRARPARRCASRW